MATFDLEPVARQSTAELIADRLRIAIMRGALEPGEQLGEADLAAKFDVSRGPVREAMQRLVSEGLLHSIRHRGIFVIELTVDDIEDVYRSRAAIERGVLERILEGRCEATYAALGPSIEMMRAAADKGDAAAVSDADQQFHEVLVQSSESPRLVRAARTLLIETRMCLGALQTTYDDLHEQVTEHETLRDAIGAGQLELAYTLLSEHMSDAVTRLRHQREATSGTPGTAS
ncbi:GntR family transcriptional regulator [Hoyosella rhizosphaerae]|uniref:Transcriptional regulator, GntR family protein n=1 Tax=Hoyosella rhizosphaerae TaxID=1755582 RepID=A0A916UCS3_9ACTN|nr:GntR family transcriptional regulator [Hoyosella rhizosphaerae]MBN4925811.1 GntR family transcriptional regulator [Hoyosella rhizosphaerae]GGC67769.1 putative transcriptional regulator, GntR family protein [Hoyosella rhizosphaerae]